MKKLLIIVAICVIAALLLSAQGQHGVQINFTQSITPGVISNSLYQSSVKGGPYTLAQTSTSPVTSFFVPVTSTNQGTFACFVVTATVIQESPFSAETCNTFPVSVSAPSGVSSKQM